MSQRLTYPEHAGLPLSGFAGIRRWKSEMEALPAWRGAAGMQADMQASRWKAAEAVV